MLPHLLLDALLAIQSGTCYAGSVTPRTGFCLVNGMHLRVTGSLADA